MRFLRDLPEELLHKICQWSDNLTLKSFRLVNKCFLAAGRHELFKRGVSIILQNPEGGQALQSRPGPDRKKGPVWPEPVYDFMERPRLPPTETTRLTVHSTDWGLQWLYTSKYRNSKEQPLRDPSHAEICLKRMIASAEEITLKLDKHRAFGPRNLRGAIKPLENAQHLQTLRFFSSYKINNDYIKMKPTSATWPRLCKLEFYYLDVTPGPDFMAFLLQHKETLRHLRLEVSVASTAGPHIRPESDIAEIAVKMSLDSFTLVVDEFPIPEIWGYPDYFEIVQHAFPGGKMNKNQNVEEMWAEIVWEREEPE